jgi:outer membrane protein TolC
MGREIQQKIAWRLGRSIPVVSTLALVLGCSPVPQEEILGENTPAPRVGPLTLPPPQSAHADDVPEIDDEWAGDDLYSDRFGNMAFRSDGAGERFATYATQLLINKGFTLATDQLSEADANAGATREWWDDGIYKPLHAENQQIPITLDDMVSKALTDSHQVKAFGVLPAIRETAVREAEGRFTPEIFAEGQIRRVNDPATSPALTAGEERLLTTDRTLEFGVRGRVRTGAEVTLAQRFSKIDTNQTDFIPGQQASSRTTLTVIQPLLRGSGLTYNNAPTRIAELDTKIAQYELVRQLENHLLEVERGYWNLYNTRANLFLSRHLARHGATLARQAASREEIDGDPTLVIRARAAWQKWQSDVVRAEAAVRNAQFRLAALTDTPALKLEGSEFITVTPPLALSPQIGREEVLTEVFARRPELQQAFLQYEAAALREGVAANESLPELDLILEGVWAGNSEQNRLGQAARDSELGGLAGLRFSVPIGYDERDARHERRKLETVQQRHQTRAALSSVLLEVEVSASEYTVAAKDLVQQRRARAAAQRELQALRSKWEDGAGFDTMSSTLNELIGAHERSMQQEASVAEARSTLAVAAANFSRSRGVLLDRWGVEIRPTTGVRDNAIYRTQALLSE